MGEQVQRCGEVFGGRRAVLWDWRGCGGGGGGRGSGVGGQGPDLVKGLVMGATEHGPYCAGNGVPFKVNESGGDTEGQTAGGAPLQTA